MLPGPQERHPRDNRSDQPPVSLRTIPVRPSHLVERALGRSTAGPPAHTHRPAWPRLRRFLPSPSWDRRDLSPDGPPCLLRGRCPGPAARDGREVDPSGDRDRGSAADPGTAEPRGAARLSTHPAATETGPPEGDPVPLVVMPGVASVTLCPEVEPIGEARRSRSSRRGLHWPYRWSLDSDMRNPYFASRNVANRTWTTVPLPSKQGKGSAIIGDAAESCSVVLHRVRVNAGRCPPPHHRWCERRDHAPRPPAR